MRFASLMSILALLASASPAVADTKVVTVTVYVPTGGGEPVTYLPAETAAAVS